MKCRFAADREGNVSDTGCRSEAFAIYQVTDGFFIDPVQALCIQHVSKEQGGQTSLQFVCTAEDHPYAVGDSMEWQGEDSRFMGRLVTVFRKLDGRGEPTGALRCVAQSFSADYLGGLLIKNPNNGRPLGD